MKMLLPPVPLGKETSLKFALNNQSVPGYSKNLTWVPQVMVVIKKEPRSQRFLAYVRSVICHSLKSWPIASCI